MDKVLPVLSENKLGHRNVSTLPYADGTVFACLISVLEKVGGGDRHAFNKLYELTSKKLFRICLPICRDRLSAEDTLHDVYLLIWQNAARWDSSRGSPITWMATIARNRSIDCWRRQKLRQITGETLAIELPDFRPSAESSAISAQSDQILHRCLSGLESKRQNAIREAFFEGATYAELAERRGVPLSTMKTWIRRGLQQMHVELLRHGQYP